MAKSEKTMTHNKPLATLITISSIVVTLVAFGVGRAYPLPVGILAAIYFSIILGVTINKRNAAHSNDAEVKRLTKEIWGYVAWMVFIVAVLGFQVWSAGGFQARSSSNYLSPTDLASQAAQQAKKSTTLPYQVDSITTVTDITSSGNTIQYHYTLHDADTSSLSDDTLKNSIQPNVCANTGTTSLLNKGVDLQYLYVVSDSSSQYSFTVTKSDCQN